MALEIGQVIDDKYRILALIGEGGMGAVYLGENAKIKRKVAIKVLHAGVAADAHTVVRFEREAQAAGTIGNDHILEILDLGELPGGDRYMVMEFLDGEPLSGRIKRQGRMTAEQVCPIVRQVLEGLAAAHAAGIVHRDLKPDNVYILKEKAGIQDYVKIIDFGISKFQPLGSDSKSMTRTGAIMGTPYYMSPEQARGSGDADLRSDLYAVGVILFEALTAQVPFEATSINELLFKIVLSEPAPINILVPELDPAFATIVTKAMAREAQHRFQTASQFIEALDGWRHAGTAVSVPPPMDPRASVIRELEAKAIKGATAQLPTGLGTGPGAQPTGNTWSQSQPGGAPPPAKSKGGLIAGIAIGAVVVFVGGGLAAWKFAGNSATQPQGVTASATTAPETASVQAAAPDAAAPTASSATPPAATTVASQDKTPPPSKTGAKTTTTASKDKDKPPPTTTKTAKPAAPDFGY
jgi:eukaryotic-like serine/threonine-protein kinase